MGAGHGLENLPDEFLRDSFVEEITHAIDEDSLWVTPSQWQRELIWMERDVETVPVARVAHQLEPSC